MRLDNWLKEHSTNAFDICAPEMEASDARDILVEEVLGPDWYITYPANGKQAMAEVVAAVVKKVKELEKPWYKKLFSK